MPILLKYQNKKIAIYGMGITGFSAAKTLKRLLRDIRCKLNLIPYNEIGGPYRRPNDDRINAFLAQLQNVSFPVTVRWSKGTDIDAGCGQLAIK